MPFDHTAENKRGRRDRRFQRVTYQVRQIIGLQTFARGNLVRVDEYEGSEFAGQLPDRLQRRIVEIATFHIRSDVGSNQPKLAHRPTQLPNRQLRRLHWERGQAAEALRMLSYQGCD